MLLRKFDMKKKDYLNEISDFMSYGFIIIVATLIGLTLYLILEYEEEDKENLYEVSLINVIDGDTLLVEADLDFI